MLRVRFQWGNTGFPHFPDEHVCEFSLDARGIKAARVLDVAATQQSSVIVHVEVADATAGLECAPSLVDAIRRRCTHVDWLSLGCGFVPIFQETLAAITLQTRIDTSYIEPFEDLLAQSMEWTADDWVRVVDQVGNRRVLPLIEHAVVHGVLSERFAKTKASIHTALAPGLNETSVRDLCVSQAELIDTRVAVGNHEFVLRRVRGASILAIAISASAWAWYLCRVSVSYPRYIHVNDERLGETRTLEDYGVDDDAVVALS